MKPYVKFLCENLLLGSFVLFVLVSVAMCADAATIWNGPPITFNQPNPDPTQASNQDRITPGVSLTRAASKGLFNAVTETAAGNLSPADTEWAMGSLGNYSTLTYQTWLNMLNGASPTTLVGKQLVVHIISEDIYFSLEFSFWGSKASGGFTYQRSTGTSLFPAKKIVNGQFSFTSTSVSNSVYVIESSSDFATWTPISTNVPAGNLFTFTDSFVTNQNRVYRVVQLAEP
jgi:hypothetical protein